MEANGDREAARRPEWSHRVPTTWIGLVAASVASLSTLVYVWYFSAALHRDTCDTSFQARTADHDFAFHVLVVSFISGLVAAWMAVASCPGAFSHSPF
jgi:cell division protein FtsX